MLFLRLGLRVYSMDSFGANFEVEIRVTIRTNIRGTAKVIVGACHFSSTGILKGSYSGC